MENRIHISYPSGYKNPQLSRVWMLPDEFKESIVKILGGHPYKPDSIAIRPGYLTQSRTVISLPKILTSLGREYLELPTGTPIQYKQALLQGGFEFLFEKINGAWQFSRIIEIFLHGYTSESIGPLSGSIRSVGEMRKFSLIRHDGGPRYLIKYTDEVQKMNDVNELHAFEQDTKAAQKKCHELDELESQIF